MIDFKLFGDFDYGLIDRQTDKQRLLIVEMLLRLVKLYNTPINKPKGLKVAKEDQRLIGSMVNGLDGQ